jgi:hypothetical protein
MSGCIVCGYVGSLDDKHVEFAHSALVVLGQECDKRFKLIRALREVIGAQHKSKQILALRREVGRLTARLMELEAQP